MVNLVNIVSNPSNNLGYSKVFPFNSVVNQVGWPYISKNPRQIVGLMALKDCNLQECRTFNEICDYCPLVFGVPNTTPSIPTYENDFTTFLVDVPIYASLPNTTVEMKLQRWYSGQWKDDQFGVILNNNNNGIYYPLGTWKSHKTYCGYAINWGRVLNNLGWGTYRFVLTVNAPNNIPVYSLCSDAIKLRAWNCNLAKGTVKFESWLKCKIGDKRSDYLMHSVNLINASSGQQTPWYDSIRLRGWFGYYKVPEYKEVLVEWGNPYHGKIERIRDEAIQTFEYISNYLPFEYHHRFSVYAMMADELRVSDYNINNSDWDIKQMSVIKAGSYEPEYIDNKGQRKSKVKVLFKKGVQGVIKTLCCDSRPIGNN